MKAIDDIWFNNVNICQAESEFPRNPSHTINATAESGPCYLPQSRILFNGKHLRLVRFQHSTSVFGTNEANNTLCILMAKLQVHKFTWKVQYVSCGVAQRTDHIKDVLLWGHSRV